MGEFEVFAKEPKRYKCGGLEFELKPFSLKEARKFANFILKKLDSVGGIKINKDDPDYVKKFNQEFIKVIANSASDFIKEIFKVNYGDKELEEAITLPFLVKVWKDILEINDLEGVIPFFRGLLPEG